MDSHEVKFLRSAVPVEFKKLPDGAVSVKYLQDGEEKTHVYGAVLLAIGRYALTQDLNLASVGVVTNPENGKVVVDDCDRAASGSPG